MSEDCPHCVFEKTEANCRGCFEGSHYKPKQITNADRIRSMTDKELADFLCDISGGESCTYCVANDLCHNGHNGMIDWLKKEVTT